jgi:hypothetical protein
MTLESAPIPAGVTRVFEVALAALKPPFMKFLVVLVFGLLMAVYLLRTKADNNLAFVLFVAVVTLFACLAGLLHYLELLIMRAESANRKFEIKETEFKIALREVVAERFEAEALGQGGRRSSEKGVD